MLCYQHQSVQKGNARGLKMCVECFDAIHLTQTLCQSCSSGFDQCETCRAPLHNSRDARELSIFKSSEAKLIRIARVLAIRARDLAEFDTQEAFMIASQGPVIAFDDAKTALAEIRDIACQPFYDVYTDVYFEVNSILGNATTSREQIREARTRAMNALNECDEACRPFNDDFENKVKQCQEMLNDKLVELQANYEEATKNNKLKYDTKIARLDAELEKLMNSKFNPWPILAGMVLGFAGFLYSVRKCGCG